MPRYVYLSNGMKSLMITKYLNGDKQIWITEQLNLHSAVISKTITNFCPPPMAEEI